MIQLKELKNGLRSALVLLYFQFFERELISRVSVHQKEYVIKNFETGYCFTESVICSQEMSFKNMLKLVLDKHFFI